MRLAKTSGSDVAAHLKRARDVLSRPGAWIQDDYAKSPMGRVVDSQSSAADRFCCSGALFATASASDRTVMARILLQKVVGGDIEVWNDAPGRQHQDVLAAFDHAIALASGGTLQRRCS